MRTTIPRQMTRDDFIGKCRVWVSERLDWGAVATKLMTPSCRPIGMDLDAMERAYQVIFDAMAIEHEVRNAVMAQTHKDFVSRERYASEFDGVAASRRSHIRRTYPDVPIQDAKIVVLEAEQRQRRAMADQAADDWQSIQQRRIQLDTAAAEFPQAFLDFTPWVPKPLT